MMNYLYVFFAGVVIGIANIIPGVSGGTMAVVMNIFDRLIEAISNIRKEWKKNILFLVMIGLGAGVGILLFANLISYCRDHFPVATNFFFVGLIVGSIPMVYKRATADSFKAFHLIPFAAALGIMIFTVVFVPGNTSAVMTELNVMNFILLFLASVLAAACMIIPGISGSFVMLLLGTYTTITTAISDFNLVILIPIVLGCAVGILGGAKVIKFLLQRYPQATYFTILGLVVGSIPVLLKNVFWIKGVFTFRFDPEFAVAVLTLIIGALLAYFLGSRVKEPEKSEKEPEAC
ncbi:MAG: DUF368 domain-containing protein [Clostridiales bacterium]|nr:DUF368 domain-containing protein [Clostridiales bacterium]